MAHPKFLLDRHLMIANTISRIIARFPRRYWVELPFPGSTDYIGPPHRPYRDEDEAIFYMIRGLKLKDLEDYVLLPLS